MKNLFVAVGVAALAGCAVKPGGQGADGGSSDGGADALPTLTSVEARQSGRSGKDLSLSIKGTDPKKTVASAWVRLLDANGRPLDGFDTNADGVPDSAEGAVTLEGVKVDKGQLTASATLTRMLEAQPNLAKVGVALQDAMGQRTSELVVTMIAQQVKMLGQKCDPTYQVDRCAPSFGCRGSPATCQEGLPPTITKLAFYTSANGPEILVEGTEPEDDLATIHFSFENASGQPIEIDSDGDGTPDLASFDYPAAGASVDGSFFIRLQAGDGLDTQVPKLVAQGIDQAGHQGVPKIASPSVMPVRQNGQACDPLGFDACANGLACAPGLVGVANNCTQASKLRAPICAAAQVLVPTAEGASVIGVTGSVSLWDAPEGCSSNDPTGRPEGVVTIRLSQSVNTLVLTTAAPATNFDTTIYLLTGCPDDSLGALGCSDDTPGAGTASTLTLTNLGPGDYLLVVDSFDYVGGTFELKATAQ
jgi:hypothetical protein